MERFSRSHGANLRKMYKPMRDLSNMTDTVSKAMVGYERIQEVLDIDSRVRDRANARQAPRFKGQVDTMVGERGVSLSGGQRQPIAIARAIIRDTPILILDEPTAGLDAASEQAVIGALDTLMKGRTSVVIAHHLSTIRHADVIFVIKDSELVEQGTHESLLALNGVYADMQGIQTPEGAKVTAVEAVA